MKKTLLLAAVGLLAASSMDAAKVYFDNTKNWSAVETWNFNKGEGTNGKSDVMMTPVQVTIDDHSLYCQETDFAYIIFKESYGNGTWNDNAKTADIKVVDGQVWDASSTLIANIVDGQYVPTGNAEDEKKDLYLYNSQDQWSADNCKMTEEDGVFTLTRSFDAGTFFKIGNIDWSTSYGGDPNVGSNDNGASLTQVTAGHDYTLTDAAGSKNLYIPSALVNVTFTFNKATKVLTVSESGGGEVEEKFWYCAWDLDGADQGKSWEFGNKMEEQEEGTFKIHVDCTNSESNENYFALFRGVTNNNWGDGTRYQPKNKETGAAYTSDVKVNLTESFPIIQGTQACWTLGNGNWTIVLDPRDPNNMTLSFDLGDSTGEANVMIDRIQDTTNEGKYQAYAMEETTLTGSDNAYKWTGSLNKGDKIKFNVHGVNYYYDPSIGEIQGDDTDFNDTLTIVYPLQESADDTGEVTFDYASDVEIIVDITNMKVTLEVLNAPRVSLNLTRGEESQVHAMTRENETTRIYTCHPIACEPGDRVDFRLLNTRYECDFNSPATRASEVYSLVEADDTSEAPELNITEAKELTFTVDAENKTVTVADGVNTLVLDITAADNAEVVYFNLQGVQIERPENGLFIEVRGSKANKVMVK